MMKIGTSQMEDDKCYKRVLLLNSFQPPLSAPSALLLSCVLGGERSGGNAVPSWVYMVTNTLSLLKPISLSVTVYPPLTLMTGAINIATRCKSLLFTIHPALKLSELNNICSIGLPGWLLAMYVSANHKFAGQNHSVSVRKKHQALDWIGLALLVQTWLKISWHLVENRQFLLPHRWKMSRRLPLLLPQELK